MESPGGERQPDGGLFFESEFRFPGNKHGSKCGDAFFGIRGPLFHMGRSASAHDSASGALFLKLAKTMPKEETRIRPILRVLYPVAICAAGRFYFLRAPDRYFRIWRIPPKWGGFGGGISRRPSCGWEGARPWTSSHAPQHRLDMYK